MHIKAITGKPTKIKTDALVVYHCEGEDFSEEIQTLDEALDGGISIVAKQGDIKGKSGEMCTVFTLGKLPAERIVIAGLGKKKAVTEEKIRDWAGTVCRQMQKKEAGNVTIIAPQGKVFKGLTDAGIVRAIAEGGALGTYTFRKYFTKKDEDSTIRTLQIAAKNKATMNAEVEAGEAIAEAVNRTRDLVNEPANYMTPAKLAEAAQEIADTYKMDIEIFDRAEIEALGMGGLMGVSQGSQQPPKFIVLKYRGTKTDSIDVALVGKGITFDSGGISIKPAENMADMKGDMAGAASVLGAMTALAYFKPEINVTGIMPATENLPSGSALKPGDVVRAMNGKTIEVLNTDAEGRLILADALSYAVKLGAKKIVDIATLTGACQVALGNFCTGAFTNNQPFLNTMLAAATKTGEYVWQLPTFPEYSELIKSSVADIKNTGGRYAGAITAAKFLEEFVGHTPWVHLDIAGTSDTDKDKGYQMKGATGTPVRTLVELVMSMRIRRRGRKKK